MQLQCNTKEFKQLVFGNIYECADAGVIKLKKLCCPMVNVNWIQFRRDNFIAIDDQQKDLIQDVPVQEIDDDF